MSARLISLAVLLAGSAHAWESTCRTYTDPTAQPAQLSGGASCTPEKGPATARGRWVGPGDEHRRLWEKTRELAGLPDAVSATMVLPVFTGPADVTVAGKAIPSLTPVAFEAATRRQDRAFSVGELTQLPDWSYSLFDYAQGHETCPVAGVATSPEDCHDFATHMGPVNANHFLPLAKDFYVAYHQRAVDRAAECKAVKAAVAASGGRFDDVPKACELEALALEAVAQHYLQDAWSMGHMWRRWGSPDLEGFAGATMEERREKAVVVALVAGLVHGSRSVLQKVPEWAGLDVDDALCAPADGVGFLGADGATSAAVGDNYLGDLQVFGGSGFDTQWQRLASCAVSGMLEVYRAAGESHGVAAPKGGLQSVQPGSEACFGQRATNRAMLMAMGVNLKVASVPITIPLDARTVSMLVPSVASSAGSVPVSDATRNRFRVDLARHVSLARLWAQAQPEGTEVADGALGGFLGAPVNASPAAGAALASYLDPSLPWPAPASGDAEVRSRSLSLARLFHRAHAGDWCREMTTGTLEALKAHVGSAAAGSAERDAACQACAEFAGRHLRVGTSVAWDTAREPLCQVLQPGAALVYQPGTAAQPTADLARAWCGCP